MAPRKPEQIAAARKKIAEIRHLRHQQELMFRELEVGLAIEELGYTHEEVGSIHVERGMVYGFYLNADKKTNDAGTKFWRPEDCILFETAFQSWKDKKVQGMHPGGILNDSAVVRRYKARKRAERRKTD